MKGRNVCTFIGNLGQAPELKYTTAGTARCKFSIAVNKQWNNDAGEKQEKTVWVPCIAWGKTAELCGKYLSQGAPVHIEAEFELNEYKGDDGVIKKTPQFTVQDVIFLGVPKDRPAENIPF